MRKSISIELALPEYGRRVITHNVEYSLHPIFNTYEIDVDNTMRSITSNIVCVSLMQKYGVSVDSTTNTLLTKSGLLRNACLINNDNSTHRFVANLVDVSRIEVNQQAQKPYMIFECKRVGRDAKNNRGPQAIEKAKQGAYVARSISSLHKIRNGKGEQMGIIHDDKYDTFTIKPYEELIQELVNTNDIGKLQDFIMTVGIISNHGSWFTSENQNKEMMVLAQSYDWLLFLTDKGLSEFVEDTILNEEKYPNISQAFYHTYSKDNHSGTQFTKIRMNYRAHLELMEYFRDNLSQIESWFNVIQPSGLTIDTLKDQMYRLGNKNWGGV